MATVEMKFPVTRGFDHVSVGVPLLQKVRSEIGCGDGEIGWWSEVEAGSVLILILTSKTKELGGSQRMAHEMK